MLDVILSHSLSLFLSTLNTMHIASKLRNLLFKSTNLKWVCCYLGACNCECVCKSISVSETKRWYRIVGIQATSRAQYLKLDAHLFHSLNELLFHSLALSISLVLFFSPTQKPNTVSFIILDSHSTWTERHDVNEDYPPKLTTSNEFQALEFIHKTTYIDIIPF